MCNKLVEVKLGSNVEEIGLEAFDGCLVARIYCYADYPPEKTDNGTGRDKNDFKGDIFSIVKANCKLYVKPECEDLYRVHPYWSQFNVQPMSEDALAIEDVNAQSQDDSERICYNLKGQQIASSQKGLSIIRMPDGSTKKMLIK